MRTIDIVTMAFYFIIPSNLIVTSNSQNYVRTLLVIRCVCWKPYKTGVPLRYQLINELTFLWCYRLSKKNTLYSRSSLVKCFVCVTVILCVLWSETVVLNSVSCEYSVYVCVSLVCHGVRQQCWTLCHVNIQYMFNISWSLNLADVLSSDVSILDGVLSVLKYVQLRTYRWIR